MHYLHSHSLQSTCSGSVNLPDTNLSLSWSDRTTPPLFFNMKWGGLMHRGVVISSWCENSAVKVWRKTCGCCFGSCTGRRRSSERKRIACFPPRPNRRAGVRLLSAACSQCRCNICRARLWQQIMMNSLNYLLLRQMAHLSLTGTATVHRRPRMKNSSPTLVSPHRHNSFVLTPREARTREQPKKKKEALIEFLHHRIFKWCIKM